MSFRERNKEQERTRLNKIVKTSSKAKNAQDDFYDEYNFRLSLVQARKKQNLSQKDLSSITGLSQQMISRVENGTTDTTLRTISKYLKGIGYNIKLTRSI